MLNLDHIIELNMSDDILKKFLRKQQRSVLPKQ